MATGVNFTLIELDTCGEPRNGQIQQILGELTGRTTVPNAILAGKSIGGGSELSAMQQKGQLKPMLEKAGVACGR